MNLKPNNKLLLLQKLILSISIICFSFLGSCKKTTIKETNSQSTIKYIEGKPKDIVMGVEKTSDGGFIYYGNTGADSALQDAFIMKIDADGNREWYKVYGGVNYDEFRKVIQTSDGGFLAVGATNSIGIGAVDIYHNLYDYVVKLNKNGIVEWSNSFFTEPCRLMGVVETSDHNYYLTGYNTLSNWNAWMINLMKLTSDGNRTYIRYFKDFALYPPYYRSNLYHGYGLDVSLAPDETAIINGVMSRSNFFVDIHKLVTFTLTTKANGTLNSLEPYFQYYRAEEYYSGRGFPFMKKITVADGYIIGSYSEGITDHLMQVELIKTDFSGKLLWAKKYSGLGNSILRGMELLPNGNIMLLGSSSNSNYNFAFPEAFFNLKAMLIQVDKEGNLIWQKFTGGEKNANIYQSVQQKEDGSFIIAGYTCLTEIGFHKMNWSKVDKMGELIK